MFPRYPLGDPDVIHNLLDPFYRDFYNAFSTDVDTDESRFEIVGWPNRGADAVTADPS